MTNQEYLQDLLNRQVLTVADEGLLRRVRNSIESRLENLAGTHRFYYAGSYGKKTVIREKYDLDIVMYWSCDCGYTLSDIYNAVGSELQKEWIAHPKTVAWTLPFDNGMNIDVVPGRAIDDTYRFANLYRRDVGTSLKTSIKVHIETIKDSGRRSAIRLMKLWKIRNNVPFKSFVLEQMTISGARSSSLSELEPQLIAALTYVRDSIETARIIDPANSNNIISDSIQPWEKSVIKLQAQTALDARTWNQVFGES
jgi:hypothetical protein